MKTRIDAVFAGQVRPMPGDGRPTAIFKLPLSAAAAVGPLGLEQDVQADRRVHGGPEKAVHHFPARHYETLRAAFPEIAAQLVPGALGENLSTGDWREEDVCLGDVFMAGTVRLQLCQPRTPCWKIDARHGVDGMTRLIAERGMAGWYYRVLEAGLLQAGDGIELVERAADAVSLREYWTLHDTLRPTREQLLRVITAPGLASDKRARWQQRLDWLTKHGLSGA